MDHKAVKKCLQYMNRFNTWTCHVSKIEKNIDGILDVNREHYKQNNKNIKEVTYNQLVLPTSFSTSGSGKQRPLNMCIKEKIL